MICLSYRHIEGDFLLVHLLNSRKKIDHRVRVRIKILCSVRQPRYNWIYPHRGDAEQQEMRDLLEWKYQLSSWKSSTLFCIFPHTNHFLLFHAFCSDSSYWALAKNQNTKAGEKESDRKNNGLSSKECWQKFQQIIDQCWASLRFFFWCFFSLLLWFLLISSFFSPRRLLRD